MVTGIRIDSKELKQALRIAPARVITGINGSLRRTAINTQRDFRKQLPVGTSGSLRRSVQYKFKNTLAVEVEPTAKHAIFIEEGTKPHWTSIGNLEKWAKMKGINPYALQKSIATHGTKAQPFVDDVYVNAIVYASRDMTRSVNKSIEEIL